MDEPIIRPWSVRAVAIAAASIVVGSVGVVLLCYALAWQGVATAAIVSIVAAISGVFAATRESRMPGVREFRRYWPVSAAVVVIAQAATCAGCSAGVDARDRIEREATRRSEAAQSAETLRQERLSAERTEQERAAREAAVAEVDAIERNRPASERAAMVVALFADAGFDESLSITQSHNLLDPIEGADRRRDDVRRALRLLATKEAEQERRAREAAEESRGLLCNDGTLSPSCTCHGSHRGCCSWHGGVAGCERQE